MVLLESIYFMLPAYVANITPVFFRRVRFLDCPLDFNRIWRGKPILGKNKTFRGIFFGTLLAIAAAYLQHTLSGIPAFRQISLVDYSNWLLLGLLLGLGSLIGDSAGSFVKRRLGKKPGERFVPLDQLDFVVGTLFFVFFVFVPPLEVIFTVFLASFLLHIVTVHIGYYIGIRKSKW